MVSMSPVRSRPRRVAGLPRGQLRRRLRHGGEPDLDLGRHRHPVEVLLPGARRHLSSTSTMSSMPSGRPQPITTWPWTSRSSTRQSTIGIRAPGSPSRPAIAARAAASSSGSVAVEDEVHQHGEVDAGDDLAVVLARSRLSTAKRQEPLARSTNTTAGPVADRLGDPLLERAAVAARVGDRHERAGHAADLLRRLHQRARQPPVTHHHAAQLAHS